MRFYLLRHCDDSKSWFTSKTKADKAASGQDTVEAVDIAPSQTGILEALTKYGSHPSHG